MASLSAGFRVYTHVVTTQPIRFTRREFDRLPEGFPAELIDGCLVSEPAPVPWHQVLVLRLRDAVVPAAAPERALPSCNKVSASRRRNPSRRQILTSGSRPAAACSGAVRMSRLEV